MTTQKSMTGITSLLTATLLALSPNGCSPPPRQPTTMESSAITYQIKQTDEIGLARTNELEVHVTDETAMPLSGINTYFISHDDSSSVLTVDPKKAYFPELREIVEQEEDNEQPAKADWGSFLQKFFIIMQNVQSIKKTTHLITSTKRPMILAAKNTNHYCVTLEQMKQSYIDVPAGIVFLAPELAGLPLQQVKLATTTPLKQLFAWYIVNKYGEQPGYEISVPKTSINLCDQTQEIICTISQQSLAQKIWSKQGIPVWEIKGGCDPLQGEEKLVVNDPKTGLVWQTTPSQQAYDWHTALQYCTGLSSDKQPFVLPTIDELRTLFANCPNLEPSGICPVSQFCNSAACYHGSCLYCASNLKNTQGTYWDTALFDGLQNIDLWSATEISGKISGYALSVDFTEGNIFPHSKKKKLQVLCRQQ